MDRQVSGVYSEYATAQEFAMRVKSHGGKNIRIDHASVYNSGTLPSTAKGWIVSYYHCSAPNCHFVDTVY